MLTKSITPTTTTIASTECVALLNTSVVVAEAAAATTTKQTLTSDEDEEYGGKQKKKSNNNITFDLDEIIVLNESMSSSSSSSSLTDSSTDFKQPTTTTTTSPSQIDRIRILITKAPIVHQLLLKLRINYDPRNFMHYIYNTLPSITNYREFDVMYDDYVPFELFLTICIEQQIKDDATNGLIDLFIFRTNINFVTYRKGYVVGLLRRYDNIPPCDTAAAAATVSKKTTIKYMIWSLTNGFSDNFILTIYRYLDHNEKHKAAYAMEIMRAACLCGNLNFFKQTFDMYKDGRKSMTIVNLLANMIYWRTFYVKPTKLSNFYDCFKYAILRETAETLNSDVYIESGGNTTLLHLANYSNDQVLCRLLLTKKVPIKRIDCFGNYPIYNINTYTMNQYMSSCLYAQESHNISIDFNAMGISSPDGHDLRLIKVLEWTNDWSHPVIDTLVELHWGRGTIKRDIFLNVFLNFIFAFIIYILYYVICVKLIESYLSLTLTMVCVLTLFGIYEIVFVSGYWLNSNDKQYLSIMEYRQTYGMNFQLTHQNTFKTSPELNMALACLFKFPAICFMVITIILHHCYENSNSKVYEKIEGLFFHTTLYLSTINIYIMASYMIAYYHNIIVLLKNQVFYLGMTCSFIIFATLVAIEQIEVGVLSILLMLPFIPLPLCSHKELLFNFMYEYDVLRCNVRSLIQKQKQPIVYKCNKCITSQRRVKINLRTCVASQNHVHVGKVSEQVVRKFKKHHV